MTNYRVAPCFAAGDRRLLPSWLQARVADQWDGICRVDTDPPADEPPTGDPVPPKPYPDIDLSKDGSKDPDVAYQTMVKERERANNLEKELKLIRAKLGTVDPEKLAEMQEAMARQKELEDEVAKRSIAQQEKYERDLREKTQALTEEKQRIQAQLEEFQQRQRVQTEFLARGGNDKAFDDFYSAISRELKPDEKGNYRIVRNGQTLYLNSEHTWAEEDKDNKRTGSPFNLSDLIEESKRNHRQIFFKVANRASGSGTMGGSVGESGGKDWRNMSPAEKIKYGRELRSKGQ